MKVYLLEHSRVDEDSEDYKTIGIFSSSERAEDTINALKDKPGFRDYPGGFNIDGYELDQVFWQSGFGGHDLPISIAPVKSGE
ncbi:MAG: hypothetical protein L0Y56_05390 [Nitrospira sp.]|nr:hypothetical protein [Nitrospira sp.]